MDVDQLPIEQEAPTTPPPVPLQEQQTSARLSGYTWDDIQNHLSDRTSEALSAGYSQREIDDHLGLPDPAPLQDKLNAGWLNRTTQDPDWLTRLDNLPQDTSAPLENMRDNRIANHADLSTPIVQMPEEPPKPTLLSIENEQTRGDYVDALLSGQVKSPGDFTERSAAGFLGGAKANGVDVTGTMQTQAGRAADQLASSLPSNEEITDHAILLADEQGVEKTPDAIQNIKRNLANEWADTSTPLAELRQQAQTDPEMAWKLTMPPTEDINLSAAEWASTLHFDQGIVEGARNIIGGATQFVTHLLPEPVTDAINSFNNHLISLGVPLAKVPDSGIAALEKERISHIGTPDQAEAMGKWTGETLVSLPMFTSLGLTGAWGVVAAATTGAAAQAAFSPTTSEDYWKEKGQQLIGDEINAATFLGAFGIAGIAISKLAFGSARMLGNTLKDMPEPRIKVINPDLEGEQAVKEIPASQVVGPNVPDKIQQARTLSDLTNRLALHDTPEALVESGGLTEPNNTSLFQRMANWMASDIFPAGKGVEGARPIEVWHASPNTFDKFSNEHIGEGEGAQQEGHGLYFAESPAVHDSYLKQFGGEYDPMDTLLDPSEGRGAQSYKVNLHVDSELLFDHDKLIKDQTEPVQRAIQSIHSTYPSDLLDMHTTPETEGQTWYNALKIKLGNEKASQELQEHGLQGIRYLDAHSSMGIQEGLPTHNYVIFHDNHIEAVERNGQVIKPADVQKQVEETLPGHLAGHGYLSYFNSVLSKTLKDEAGGAPNPFRRSSWRTPEQLALKDQRAEGFQDLRELFVRNQARATREHAYWTNFLDQYQSGLTKPVREFQKEFAKGTGGDPMNTTIGHLLDYIEGRSAGVTLPPGSKLQPLANAIRAGEQTVDKISRQQMLAGKISSDGYIQDHLMHQFKNPRQVQQTLGGGGQLGYKGSLLERKGLPTYGDAIRAGAKPLYDNPIDGFQNYMHGRLFYHQTVDMMDEAREQGNIYWAAGPRGDNDVRIENNIGKRLIASPASVPLKTAEAAARSSYKSAAVPFDTRLASLQKDVDDLVKGGATPIDIATARNNVTIATHLRATALKPYRDIVYSTTKAAKPTPMEMHAYGTPGFGEALNRALSRGLFTRQGDTAWDKLLYAKNMMTSIKLLNPIFHGRVMILGAIASHFAQAMDEIGRGSFLKAMGSAAKIGPIGFTQNINAGRKAIRDYASNINDPVIQYLSDAGLRFGPRQREYNISGAEKLRYGSIFHTLGQDIKTTIGTAEQATWPRILRFPDRVGQLALTEMGRMMQTFTHPIFDLLIPQLKTGIAYRRLKSFMDDNPIANPDVITKKATEIAKDVENRLGELNQDTLFWNRITKNLHNLGAISTGWWYGTFRGTMAAIGVDIETGTSGFARRANVTALNGLIGSVLSYGLLNAFEGIFHDTYPGQQHRESGRTVSTPITDMMNFRTGKYLKDGMPERAFIPFEGKEFYDIAKVIITSVQHPLMAPVLLHDYISAKEAPYLGLISGLAHGVDTIGNYTNLNVHEALKFLKGTFVPIFMEQLNERKHGTGITPLETLLGTKEAPKFVEDPEAYKIGLQHMIDMKEKFQSARERKENAQLANPDPSISAPKTRGRTLSDHPAPRSHFSSGIPRRVR